jgi:uncharacterized protein
LRNDQLCVYFDSGIGCFSLGWRWICLVWKTPQKIRQILIRNCNSRCTGCTKSQCTADGIAPLCLWHLRSEFALWLDYFTWTAVRYTIIFNRVASIALVLCVAWTVSTIVWQIRHKGWGMSREERRLLERRVLRIRKRGQGHPLWRWVVKGNSPGERLRHR